jgi:hypothetical protein
MFPEMPKFFNWHSRERAPLSVYIDRLYLGDSKFLSQAEREGRVSGIEYPTSGEVNAHEWYSVSPQAILASIALRSPCDVPLWGKVKFLTDGTYLVPCGYIGALVAADSQLFGHLNPDANWKEATEHDLRAMGVAADQVTSGRNRWQQHSPQASVLADETDTEEPKPITETTLRRVDKGTHVDWITRTTDGDRVWYSRRLYRDAQVFYEATSWQRHGPWKVWSQDSSVLLALGVTA